MTNMQLIGLGIIAYAVLNNSNNNSNQYRPEYRNVPPPPPRNSGEFDLWVAALVQSFGLISDLFKDGGPLAGLFKNEKDPELIDIIYPPGQNDYGDYA